MGEFTYIAITQAGQRTAGRVAAQSEVAAMGELESRGLTPLTIKQLRDTAGPGSHRALPARSLGESYQQISDMLHAGVPLLRALRVLGQRKKSPAIAKVFTELAQQVERGSDLASAMEACGGVFAGPHVAMVRAGERGGFLDSVLAQLGMLVIKRAELRSKVIGNLVYPGVLITLGVAITILIFAVFVPKLRPTFAKLEEAGQLPAITSVVFALGDAVTKHGLITLCVLGAIAGGLMWARRKPTFVRWAAGAQLRLPVIGPMIRGFATAGLCRLLGTMLASNVPMLTALNIAKDGTGHPLMRAAVEEAAEAVKQGQALTQPLERSGLIDDDVVEMMRVGETANNLAEVLQKVAVTLETRLDRLLNIAVKLVEPLLLVAVAAVVGTVAIALLLPLTKLSQAM
jgi:general secretion pathway protein F